MNKIRKVDLPHVQVCSANRTAQGNLTLLYTQKSNNFSDTIRKVGILLVVTIILWNVICIIPAQAKSYPIQEADLYSKGEVIYFFYNGIRIGVEVVVHKKDGIEYPAYCINKGTPGVTSQDGYAVTIDDVLSNEKVRRAILNGYPFKSYEQLGCANEMEAFAATKMAVYDALYEPYDLEKFKPIGEEGERVVNAIKNIITQARTSNEVKASAYLTIQPVEEEWKIDEIEKSYISREYRVISSANTKQYSIDISNKNEIGMKLTDCQNIEKNTFNKTENFKILIPILELQRAGEVKIKAKADLETNPIFFGNSHSENLQNYAITAGKYEEGTGELEDIFPENKTKIEITKQDSQTKEKLEGGIFQLLDAEKGIIQSDLVSDSDGKIEINNLLPGKYYLQEIKSPDGYIKHEELIMIDLTLNENYKIIVNNQKEIKKTVQKDKENKIEIGVKKLPKTGY